MGLDQVEALLVELQGILSERTKMRECAREEKFSEALKMNGRLLHTLRSERFEGNGPNIFSRMREDLRSHLEDTKQQLRERFTRQSCEAEIDGGEFSAEHIEELLEKIACSGIQTPSKSVGTS